ncbi:DUF2490 domain-containing protein [Ginsengibacter hankyongi]|uniref:DUF2490 domain-containing protein n=1 Tax=Ginsengibacter hankyongi TaxID=2607284 RepID=A0A5J5IGL2_9BACT|nr:DUF2490 domain-containing protein [Ginsengibacter hankyongi]KAA9038104.1 DUF2490 domain-containing protein [Ginsengibacter hankyongi]
MILQQNIVLAILLFPVASVAQRTTQRTNMIWAGYYNTIRLPNKWSIPSDVQLRTKDWTNKWSQLLVRSGLAYSLNNNFSVTGGLAFFKNAQYADKKLLLKNEWRPWQELFYQLAIHKTNLVQRLRAEQRFLQEVVNNKKINSYQYIFRLRYKFEWQFPLDENNTRLLIGNEIMVNPGNINAKSFFDQNRISSGINFKLNSITNLQCQYIKIFLWHSSTSVLEDQNIFRVNIFQQFNFKKTKKTKQA